MDFAGLTRNVFANEKRVFIVAVGIGGMYKLYLQLIPIEPG